MSRSSIDFACPVCLEPTPRLLEASSQYANVNYYRCPKCAHVWTVAKDDPTQVTHVTPLPPRVEQSGRRSREG